MNEKCETITELMTTYWAYIYILIPIVIIVLIVFSYARAVMSSEADALKKAHTANIRRLIAGVILVMLPFLIRTIFDLFGIDFCI
ncbi:MAG TPA: hypothetical protein PKY25_00110 [Bacilli bacterium]|nr:hypothetical protein [Bacilli bacterium]